MSWRYLLCLPLAAWLVGETAGVKNARKEIPHIFAGCNQEEALRSFLMAFAYREENPARSGELCWSARRLAEPCREPVLLGRISEICD